MYVNLHGCGRESSLKQEKWEHKAAEANRTPFRKLMIHRGLASGEFTSYEFASNDTMEHVAVLVSNKEVMKKYRALYSKCNVVSTGIHPHLSPSLLP